MHNKAGHDQSDIARVMNRNKSTISRELKRNRGDRGYLNSGARPYDDQPVKNRTSS